VAVEAETEEAAYTLLDDGEGEVTDRDVLLVSVEPGVSQP
jgi:hypothetical protein